MGIPNNVLYFYTYEELAPRLKKRFSKEHPINDAIPGIAGASARFVASLATAPLELLRTQQAARAGGFIKDGTSESSKGMISEFRSMIRTDGPGSLFRGVYPTLMRDVPFSALYWLSIEKMRDFWHSRRLRNRRQQQICLYDNDTNKNALLSSTAMSTSEQTAEAFVNGSVSGVLAAAFTTPLDVLKTRIQVEVAASTTRTITSTNEAAADCIRETASATVYNQGSGAIIATHPKSVPTMISTTSLTATSTKSPPSVLQIARSIVETEGIFGLWRGNAARCMKVAPACGIMISTYETGKRLLAVD